MNINKIILKPLLLVVIILIGFQSQSQIISTVAGRSWVGDGALATNAALKTPQSIYVDSADNIYIADIGRIRKISPSGVISTVAGTGVNGYSGEGFLATTGMIGFRGGMCYNYTPVGITMDRSGNLIIAESSRLRKVTPAGMIYNFAGDTAYGFSGDGGAATAARLNGITGICADKRGNVYVSDVSNNRIRKINSSGIITTIAGTGTRATTGDGAIATASSLALDLYSKIAVDTSGNIYFYETFKIRKIDVSGRLSTVVGNGTPAFSGDGGAASSARITGCTALNIDKSGNFYIAFRTRIRKINTSGIINTIMGNDSSDFRGDGGPATAARVNDIEGIGIDSRGNVILSDLNNHRVRRIDTSSIIRSIAGGYFGDGNLDSMVAFICPEGMALDSRGNMYVADLLADNIRKIDATTHRVSTVCGTGIYGFSGDGGPATAAKVANPYFLYVDRHNSLYFTDHFNNRIRKVDSSGIITTVVGTGIQGFSGDGGPATAAKISLPGGICKDTSGNLYFTDFTCRVRKVTPSGVISTFAGRGCSSTFSYSGEGGPATAAELSPPLAVSADRNGNVFVSDYFGIRKINSSGIITSVTGAAYSMYSGDCGPATSAAVTHPDFCLDTFGSIYTSYYPFVCTWPSLAHIRKTSHSDIICRLIGTNVYGYSGDGGMAWNADITYGGLLVDNAGDLLFTDRINGVIRKESFASNHAPRNHMTGPHEFNFCSSAASFDSCLGEYDAEIGQTLNFFVKTIPSHGTISLLSVCELTTGGLCTPSGFTYTPTSGFTGRDTFYVEVWDGIDYDTVMMIAVWNMGTGTMSGPTRVCVGDSVVFTATTAGGSWATGSSAIASVDTSTGTVIGVSGGTTAISYTVSGLCAAVTHTAPITVIPPPVAGSIIGSDSVCVGTAVLFTDTAIGGNWISSNLAIATITAAGSLTGVSAGLDTVYYIIFNSCGVDSAYLPITVTALPFAGVIAGIDSVCPGTTVTLIDSAMGGYWISSNTTIATVDSAGSVLGITAGIINIYYVVTNDCGSDTAVFTLRVRNVAPCVIGIPETLSTNQNLVVYPNPTTGALFINVIDPVNQLAQVRITNTLGQQIMNYTQTTNRPNEINLQVSTGVYFINVITDKNNLVKTIVVQ